jgi:cell wall-associated NlpC family hydrolase
MMGAGSRIAAAGAAVLVLYAAAAHGGGAGKASADTGHSHTPPMVAHAISYAWAQVGKPYCWGGTGGCPNPPYHGYDCSGLMFEAYGFPSGLRTSQQQWAGLRHVSASDAQPGDLVFAPGADGTWAKPGHVGMLLSHGRVLQAFGTGYPIFVTSLSDFAARAGGIVGFATARPTGGA